MSFKSILFAGVAALSLTSPALAGDVEIHDSYARAANTKAGAAFMMIHNNGDADDRLIGASSPAAKKVELHTHIENADGVMKMVHVEEGFELPAGGMVHLKRGGKHVMFMGLNAPFEQGAKVPLTLVFEKAGEVELEVEVDLERKAGHGDHSGHTMSE